MSMRKGLLVTAIVVVVAAAAVGAWALRSAARRATAVAATVNGEAILWSQVDAEIARAAAQFGIDTKSPDFEKQRAEIGKAVLDQLIGARLIMQEARRRHLVASDKEIEEQVDAIRKRFPTEAEFNTALARNGFTLASLRDVLRVNVTQRRLADAVAPGTVTEEEVRRQFETNRAQYDQPAQIKVSHILFRIGEKEQEPLAWAKAKIVQARLAEGATFEDLARQYSDDKGSAERGGDLGFVSKGTLVKEFEDAAWALKPGQTSGPVRTQYGLHIIKVHEVRDAQKADFDRVKQEIREQLLASKREKAFEAWLNEQRKAAKIERLERP
ncbi:MAG: peptidylprolyl isomerase [Firmicutes bacterium]|nr:peptidylprolyl isomerase [Bacillota bacterium]